MISFIKRCFKKVKPVIGLKVCQLNVTDDASVQKLLRDVGEQVDARMVGEPVLSFLKALRENPKRFKLKAHTQDVAKDTGSWGTIYQWMDDARYTGYYSMTDKKTGDVYYAIYHKGKLYRVNHLGFHLNWWELNAISEAMKKFRLPARERKNRINQAHRDRVRMEKDLKEKEARVKLAEKFKN